jgi:transposase
MNSDYYLENIVAEHVTVLVAFAQSNFCLTQDNARLHVVTQVIDHMNAVDILFMEWRPNSLDLNPIEHQCDALKKKVRSRTPPPFNHNQQVGAVIDQWENTP